jgi:hypothetical protein
MSSYYPKHGDFETCPLGTMDRLQEVEREWRSCCEREAANFEEVKLLRAQVAQLREALESVRNTDDHADPEVRAEVRAALASDAPSPAKCADCGAALNAGEAASFTVCDGCWDRAYPNECPRCDGQGAKGFTGTCKACDGTGEAPPDNVSTRMAERNRGAIQVMRAFDRQAAHKIECSECGKTPADDARFVVRCFACEDNAEGERQARDLAVAEAVWKKIAFGLPDYDCKCRELKRCLGCRTVGFLQGVATDLAAAIATVKP